MKLSVKKQDYNTCVLTFGTMKLYFWAPPAGGYIYEVTHGCGTSGRQQTDEEGNTLYWHRDKPLSYLIRQWAAKIGVNDLEAMECFYAE